MDQVKARGQYKHFEKTEGKAELSAISWVLQDSYQIRRE